MCGLWLLSACSLSQRRGLRCAGTRGAASTPRPAASCSGADLASQLSWSPEPARQGPARATGASSSRATPDSCSDISTQSTIAPMARRTTSVSGMCIPVWTRRQAGPTAALSGGSHGAAITPPTIRSCSSLSTIHLRWSSASTASLADQDGRSASLCWSALKAGVGPWTGLHQGGTMGRGHRFGLVATTGSRDD